MSLLPYLDPKRFLRFSESPKAPDDCCEQMLRSDGFRMIAGVDEAGRGPLAGPVVAAAVILEADNFPTGLNDSKKLTETRRAELFDEILSVAQVAISVASPQRIDRMNIRAASLWAMSDALIALPVNADAVLIDGNALPENLPVPGFMMIKGDARSISIAAASIIAKTIRDRMMLEADLHYPHYGFAAHKGYPTQHHRNALLQHGPCAIHRKTFKPVQLSLEHIK